MLNMIYRPLPLNSIEEVVHNFKEQEELKCDCLYLAIRLGTVHLRHVRLFQDYLIQTEKLIEEGKSIPPLQGVKIGFNDDSSITIDEPSYFQGVFRSVSGTGRRQLGLIRPHLVQLLRWFDYKNEAFEEILTACKLGLEVLLKGYLEQSQVISISQTIIQSERKEEEAREKSKKVVQVLNIPIQKTPETDLVICALRDNIDFLSEALKKKDERQEKEFAEKLEKERFRYFHLYDLQLIKVAKTIDEYMAAQLRARWSTNKLSGIVNFFKAAKENPEDFSHCESIEKAISPNPEIHQSLKLEVRELLSTTLPNDKLEIKSFTEGREEKEKK